MAKNVIGAFYRTSKSLLKTQNHHLNFQSFRNISEGTKLMAENSSVKLHGFWASPYSMRVGIALKVKGIDYEYIEEDMSKKSELLLKYNPATKKVPVLVHNGKPIAESLVILEYLDEVWPETPALLPKDHYLRAKHRFWAAYFQPVFAIVHDTFTTEGETQKKKVNELLEKLDAAEEGIKEIYPNGAPSFEAAKPGYLDIAFYSLFGTHEAADEFFGFQLLTAERYPLLLSWAKAVGEVPEVKEVIPPIPKLVGFLQYIRQMHLAQKA